MSAFIWGGINAIPGETKAFSGLVNHAYGKDTQSPS